MPDNKTKKESHEEAPKIVEVYGDDELQEQKKALKEKVEDEVTVKAPSRPSMVVEKVEEELDKEEKMDDKGGMKTEVVVEDIQSVVEEKQKEPMKIVEKSQDDKAFEEEIGHQKRAVRGVFGIGVIIFLLIFGLTGWAFYLKTVWLPSETTSEVLVAEATPLPTSTPQPTLAPLNREEISLEILNGSGVPGLAGKTATMFEDLGYSVPEVGNGNTVASTEVYVQEELEERLSLLMDDLLENLNVSSVAGYLDEDDEVTARVVLGE